MAQTGFPRRFVNLLPRLRDPFREYVFFDCFDSIPEGYERLEFFDEREALYYLRPLAQDSFNLAALRQLVYGTDPSPLPLRDEELLWRVATWLRDRRVRLARAPRVPLRIAAAPTNEEMIGPPPAPPATEVRETTFELVEEGTGRPIRNVTLRLRTADEAEHALAPDANGCVTFKDAPLRAIKVLTDWPGKVVHCTLGLVSIGPPGAATAGSPPPEVLDGGDAPIVYAEPYRVRSGDTLASVAERAGLRWQELAEFNWGTSVPAEVNVFLRDQVGCSKKTPEGLYYFDSDDTPGIVYVPYAWGKKLDAGPRERVTLRRHVAVLDYGFARDGEYVGLSFSTRGPAPAELFVQLCECPSRLGKRRRAELVAAAVRRGESFAKSGLHYRMPQGEALSDVARRHGWTDIAGLWQHPANALVRTRRETPERLQEGDIVYIPQRPSDTPLAIGPRLTAEETSETVPDGKRWRARWSIAEGGWDPLDIDTWLSDLGGAAGRAPAWLYLPQFAVLDASGHTLGVSPTPPRLVHGAELQPLEHAKRLRVLLADGKHRKVPGNVRQATFETHEEPLAVLAGWGDEAEAEEV